ncbi:MAG: aspartate kinase [Rickettsiales bacterium]|jgi:aspartate kinase|nr:aspartate kinase [Rickettsiales bacterium]
MQIPNVAKFGGGVFSSESKMPLLRAAVDYELARSKKLIVVVSAIGKTTDDIISGIPAAATPATRDAMMSVGETVSSRLFAKYLLANGFRAAAFSGWDAGITTDSQFGDARIIQVDPAPLTDFFRHNDVAVVAGFQGANERGEITTLGRNGSDTTAVYLAYRFASKICTLYKDVDGIFEANPKARSDARLYKYLNHKELFDGEAKGIVHARALGLIKNRFATGGETEIVVRNIDLARESFTTICHKATEVYR